MTIGLRPSSPRTAPRLCAGATPPAASPMVRQMAVETVTRPRGPYSLRLSARLASDATRRFRAGRLEAVLPGGELAAAWQLFDGAVVIRADSEAGAERMRFVLGL